MDIQDQMKARLAAYSEFLTKLSHNGVVTDLEAELTGRLASLGLTDVDSRAVDALAIPSLDVIRCSRDDADSRSTSITSHSGRNGNAVPIVLFFSAIKSFGGKVFEKTARRIRSG